MVLVRMAFVSTVGFRPSRAHNSVQARPKRASTSFARIRRGTVMTTTVVEKGAGMRLIKDADEEMISKLGCRSWSTWGCDASSFPWTYSDDEVCFVLEGEVRVIPDDGSEPMGASYISELLRAEAHKHSGH